MKANEVPDKIYRTTLYLNNDKGESKWKRQPVAGAENIEYTRTDAFIEKAEEFIYSALNDGIMDTANIEDFMRLFKNYMKGE